MLPRLLEETRTNNPNKTSRNIYELIDLRFNGTDLPLYAIFINNLAHNLSEARRCLDDVLGTCLACDKTSLVNGITGSKISLILVSFSSSMYLNYNGPIQFLKNTVSYSVTL